MFRNRKRRLEATQLLNALLERHPTGKIYVVWENVSTHKGRAIEEIVSAAAGRLVILYLPTYSPWLNPIEMLWRHFRREVTRCKFFESLMALTAAAQDYFDRYNLRPQYTLSIIGSNKVTAQTPEQSQMK